MRLGYAILACPFIEHTGTLLNPHHYRVVVTFNVGYMVIDDFELALVLA